MKQSEDDDTFIDDLGYVDVLEGDDQWLMSLNVRSIVGNGPKVKDLFENQKPMVVAVQEVWQVDKINFSFHDYEFEYEVRIGRKGGGVGILIHKSITYHKCPILSLMSNPDLVSSSMHPPLTMDGTPTSDAGTNTLVSDEYVSIGCQTEPSDFQPAEFLIPILWCERLCTERYESETASLRPTRLATAGIQTGLPNTVKHDSCETEVRVFNKKCIKNHPIRGMFFFSRRLQ